MADYYAVLEVQQTATAAEIHSAYRRMALLHHPDKNLENKEAATERFQEVLVSCYTS
jgi:DnaJ family protein A protein 5